MRSAGILLPVTALPSPFGIGTMGEIARRFIQFLKKSGQSYWQILPLNPTSYGDSPYQSFSSFAGNPYLIDLDELKKDGLLKAEEYETLHWGDDPACVDYGLLYETRFPVLQKAASRLQAHFPDAFARFCQENAAWLEDYALFMALKDEFSGKPWLEWPKELKNREPNALQQAGERLCDSVHFWKAVQFFFFNQWQALKQYANDNHIQMIGDLPIYAAADSADIWASPEQFQLDDERNPIEVAGCPPDGFSADGQLWGNPLFDWDSMKKDGFSWWIRRISYQFRLYDVLRIDHFRGFDAYYAIPAGAKNAQNGRWRTGPGIEFFRALERALGKKNIIAEDLGFLTPSVHQLLKDTGYPGMKVLEFAFDSRDGGGSNYLPHNYPHHCIAYIGTHDNETALGWLENAPPEDVALAREYLHLDPAEGEHWGMMRALWASPAGCTIVQMQDLLGLGHEARFNTPSTVGQNWRWRAEKGFDSDALAKRIHRQMELYERLAPQPKQKSEEKASLE